MVTLCVFHTNIKHVKRLVICSHWRLIASYHAMTHNNDVQTVHTRQTWSVCKPWPRLIFEARLVFKARPLVQLRQNPGLYSRPGLYLRPDLYSRKYGTLNTCTQVVDNLGQIWGSKCGGMPCKHSYYRPYQAEEWRRGRVRRRGRYFFSSTMSPD